MARVMQVMNCFDITMHRCQEHDWLDSSEEDFLEEDFLEAGLLRIFSLITILTGSSPLLEDDCSVALLRLVVGNSRNDFLLYPS